MINNESQLNKYKNIKLTINKKINRLANKKNIAKSAESIRFTLIVVIVVLGAALFSFSVFSQKSKAIVLDMSLSADNYDPVTKTFYNKGGGDHNGISINNASFNKGLYGSLDGAMEFDGRSDYIKINSSSAFNTGADGSFSFSAWIKSSDYSPKQLIISRANSCSNAGHFNIYTQGNKVYLSFYSNLDRRGGSHYSTNEVLEDGKAYNIVWTKTWGELGVKLYINGSPVNVSGDSSIKGTTYNVDIFIGAQNRTDGVCDGPLSNFFNGTIESIGVYNYILSENEVKNLYDSSRSVAVASPTLSKGLVAHWSMDSKVYEEGTVNLAPFTDYSNRNYNQKYDASCWGGDTGFVEYFEDGGYNNFPYKKLTKTGGGTGGCYLDDNAYFEIENNKTYIISAYLKASRDKSFIGHILNINRPVDNAYRAPGSINVTTEWKRYSWVYNSAASHAGDYITRHIIYQDGDLPLEVYWSGFQIEEASQLTPYVKGSRIPYIVDKTPYKNHGINHGTTFTEDRFGKEGGAMSFNGYDNVISTNPFKLNNELSVCAWIRPDTLTTKEIIIHGSPSTGAFEFYQSGRGLSLRGGGVSPSVSTSNVLSLNDWGFACANINNNYGEIYYNGELMASGSVASPNSTSEAVHIGAHANSAYAFQGVMDDVRIYNRTLSELEIKSLYDTYNPKTTTGTLQQGLILDMPLKLKYTKSETPGSQVMTDRTPFSNDAQNYGSTFIDEGSAADFSYLQGSRVQSNFKTSDYFSDNGEFTLSFWTKLKNSSVNRSGLVNMNRYFTEVTAGGFGVMLDRNNIFAPHLGTRSKTFAIRSSSVPIGEWQHVLITYKDNNFKFYQNSELISAIYAEWIVNDQPLLIGRGSQGGWTNTSDAAISNILIYNRSLSEEEVKTLYDRGRSDAGIIFQEN